VAHRILQRVSEEYLESYAVIAYLCDVDVLRPGKFSIGPSA
jgi:hypothetical protein